MGILFTAVGAWAVSRVFDIPELGMGAVAALVLLVLAVLATRLGSVTLRTRRSVHPHRLYHDAVAEVELTITNPGRLPSPLLQVDDLVPSLLSNDTRFSLRPIAGGDAVRLRYRLQGRTRGRYEIGPVRVGLRDPFGVAQRLVEIGPTDVVTVYPPVWQLPAGVPLGGHQGVGGGGQTRPLMRGEGLANVREYVRGDDLRKVHWPSTAHRGKLMLRQEEAPQHPTAVVLLDRDARHHAGSGPTSSLEYCIAAAASVTHHLARRGFQLALLDTPITGSVTRLARPWELVMEHLASVEEGEVDVDDLLQQLSHGLAGEGTIIVVAPVPDPDRLRRLVRAGRSFQSRAAVLVDAPTFDGRGRRGTVEAEQRTAALRAAGWRVTLVRAGDRLDQRWRELLRAPGGSRVKA